MTETSAETTPAASTSIAQTLKKPCPKRRHRPLRNVRAFQGKN